MKAEDLIFKNIENLVSLWKTVSEKAGYYTSEGDFDCSLVPYSEWPNRLWFSRDMDEEAVSRAKKVLLATSKNMTVPYWDIYQSQSYELLESNGFEVRFEQVGMSLKLTQSYDGPQKLRLKKVSTEEDARLWETLFQQAFGYIISHKLLLQPFESTDFMIVIRDEMPVGSVVLHHTSGNVMGIHAMGIIPEMRKQGLAEQLMKIILNNSLEQGFRFATLQASAMGKGLYAKLGFEEQFVMKNYSLIK